MDKEIISKEYDFSNILPTVEYVSLLVKYCDGLYNQLIKLCEEDEERNKSFKPEYQNYTYKKYFGNYFEIYINGETVSGISCKDYEQFESAVKGGSLKNVRRVKIDLKLNFKRGNGNNLEEHENEFMITFSPYDIKFIRKSNHNDQNMNQIEQQIIDILNKFPISNCIFCDKNN